MGAGAADFGSVAEPVSPQHGGRRGVVPELDHDLPGDVGRFGCGTGGCQGDPAQHHRRRETGSQESFHPVILLLAALAG
ncbi:hypothetical protein [Pseudarthrobacter oxydans]|uniref:hypothetical protein n=1 Tax=Pseudarthrobacter oxydans TaxID=1671 RepID=UPI00341A4F2D